MYVTVTAAFAAFAAAAVAAAAAAAAASAAASRRRPDAGDGEGGEDVLVVGVVVGDVVFEEEGETGDGAGAVDEVGGVGVGVGVGGVVPSPIALHCMSPFPVSTDTCQYRSPPLPTTVVH